MPHHNRQPSQAVADEEEHVVDAAVLQIGEHRQPELGSLPAGAAHKPRTSISPANETPIAA